MVSQQLQGPYAPIKNVLSVIKRRRDRGLTDPVAIGVLQSIGIPPGNAPRTLQALKLLGLIDEDGRRTSLFDRLGSASTDDYSAVFSEILRAAYGPVFTLIDPARDDIKAITDAFRQYQPEAQRSRMVTLFIGLCEEAGIRGRPPRSHSAQQAQRNTRTRKQVRASNDGSQETRTRKDTEIILPDPQTDYRLVAAVVQQLPQEGKWTKSRRERWLSALTSAVDLIVEVVDDDVPN